MVSLDGSPIESPPEEELELIWISLLITLLPMKSLSLYKLEGLDKFRLDWEQCLPPFCLNGLEVFPPVFRTQSRDPS